MLADAYLAMLIPVSLVVTCCNGFSWVQRGIPCLLWPWETSPRDGDMRSPPHEIPYSPGLPNTAQAPEAGQVKKEPTAVKDSPNMADTTAASGISLQWPGLAVTHRVKWHCGILVKAVIPKVLVAWPSITVASFVCVSCGAKDQGLFVKPTYMKSIQTPAFPPFLPKSSL